MVIGRTSLQDHNFTTNGHQIETLSPALTLYGATSPPLGKLELGEQKAEAEPRSLYQADVEFPRLKHLWLEIAPTEMRTKARIGGKGSRVERGARRTSAKACSRRGADGLGTGVDQRRYESGLAKAPATTTIRRPAASVGSRADVFLDLSEQEDELRDYERLAATSEAFIYVAMSA